MDFRTASLELVEKENLGIPQNGKNEKSSKVVSILKSSQKLNCLSSEKRQTKVSFKNSPTRHNYNTIPHRAEVSFEWEEIRRLDDEWNWTERTQVVTKEDHTTYTAAAREFLDTVIAELPCFRENQPAENMSSSPKLPEINTTDDIGISPNSIDNADDENPTLVHEPPSFSNLVLPQVPDEDLAEEITSEFSKLQVESSDCPRTFSPIGSERTSPEEENMMDSNEDIDKLLATHDDLPENEDQDLDMMPSVSSQAGNLLTEMTSEGASYKSAELFMVKPSDLENEFMENNVSNDLDGGDGTQDVEDVFEKLAEGQQEEDVFEKLAESQQEEDDGFADEVFKPASEAMWELDYLEQCGNNNKGFGMSALARQSLYVKFDPLVKGGSPQHPVKNNMGLRDVLPQKPPSMGDNLLLMDSPQPQTKASLVSRRPNLRDHPTQGKPAGFCGVDQLLSFSPQVNEGMKTEPEVEEEKVEESSAVETQSEPEPEISNAKEEEKPPREGFICLGQAVHEKAVKPKALFFSKEDFDEAVRRETEVLRKQAEEESLIREMENKDLADRNQQLKRETGELRVVMQEYEKTIADMIESNQKSQDSYTNSATEVAKERDQLQADLTAVETAFSDLHRRYEKLKGVVENFKKNEEILKKATSDYQDKLKKSEEKYRLLKKHAEEKIESANIEISRVRRANESEIAVMKAALKKEQTKTASLEMSLQQKVSENGELTAICDELISKMGGQR